MEKFKNYESSVEERFIRYAQIDTEADPNSNTMPSSMKQKDLSKLLVQELKEMGIHDAELDANGYVYASIESNVDFEVPVLCFCSHVDTSPDVTGKNVKPIVRKNYDGKKLAFPDDSSLFLDPKEHPYLLKRIGDDIVTASGLSLLGADDKAGVAIIMDFAKHLCNNPEIKHGKIRILFTPDEEIGRGVDGLDMKKLGADFGYTLDGGERGSLEGESFSADACKITFYGISAHPGYAKNKMVSAIKVASAFVDLLPKDTWCPEKTEGREGFVHPLSIEGTIEKTTVQFIVRDFETKKLKEYADKLDNLAKETIAKFEGSTYTLEVNEQYRNMGEILEQNPQVMEYAKEAYRMAGLETHIEPIRGGTDGSRLSFMGLPCPNIFTGEMAIHSRVEYVSVQDMEKAVECLYYLCNIWTQNAAK